MIKKENVLFIDDFAMSATYMHSPAFKALKSNQFEDVAYFEPLYLKDFITTTQRKNIL